MILGGLYLTWRRVFVAQEGQVTERFTRAIDQLGAVHITDNESRPNLEVRLGGIYALERIARDSPPDHWPIMEVLTAYVREHARWKPPPEGVLGNVDLEAAPAELLRSTPDIQAILTVLGRRKQWYGHGEKDRLDLSETDLRGAGLRGAHLKEAWLQGAHLGGAYYLTPEQLQQAYWDTTTRWPAGYTPPTPARLPPDHGSTDPEP